jgi:LAO/AO transport system kinase
MSRPIDTTEPPGEADPAADLAALADGVRAGDRRAIGRAITLVESTRADHRARAETLLANLLPFTGDSIRIGISGAPGVGKSTFIESFGLHVIDQGHRVAVLAVDPSSARTGGSILGDQTRMEELSRNERAFIRPTPTGGTLGGVARRTREVVLVCEAAGFDVVIVETVGVGQSELAVAAMVDIFVLLIAPGGGDELQGIKRGIMEFADLLIVTKDDGDLAPAARRTAAEYASALGRIRPRSTHWDPQVQTVSSIAGTGIGKVWQTIEQFAADHAAGDAREERRRDQAEEWLRTELVDGLVAALRDDPAAATLVDELAVEVRAGRVAAPVAARRVLERFLDRRRPTPDQDRAIDLS